MAFTAPPLVAGDAFDLALRVGLALDQDLSTIDDPAERMACLERHWREVTALGWVATLVPEADGGVGGALPDLAALADGAGRTALALPLASGCAVVPTLLFAGGEGARRALAALAAGEMNIGAVLPPADHNRDTPRLTDALRLEGGLVGIEAPPAPTHFLIACPDAKGEVALVLLPADTPGLTATPHQRIDGRLSLDLAFGSVPVAQHAVLARGDAVRDAVERARDLGALLTCVEAVAAMGALIEQTIGHLSARSQFGTALSTFQALRHRVAEMYLAYANLRALVTPLLNGSAAPSWRDVAFAKLRLGEAGRFVAQSAIQLHGGMGMTEGLPAIRLARRILMTEFEYGDRTWYAARLLAANDAEAARHA